MTGELTALDGSRWTLRFTRRLTHPVDRVWRAITEAEHLKAWFPDRIVGDLLTSGAALRFVQSTGDGFDGRVLAVDPPRLLELQWGTDRLRFEVVPTGDGCTLTLTDTITEVGKAARDGAGWHVCLDFLEAELAGTPADFTMRDRWEAVHGDYVAAFGPEASTIGPPEGS